MTNPNNINDAKIHHIEFIDADVLQIPTLSFLDHQGQALPGVDLPKISQEVAVKIFHTMQFIQILDERMVAAQRQGRISFYMQCLGEEAAVTASTAALKDDDMIMSQYREQAALHYRGFSLDGFMNQLFSNRHDLGKGRQMPIHYGSKALNYFTVSSPLGTQIPQATGYAFGQKMAGKGQCTICYFGEGAASEGDFHAGLNMAAVHQVPAIFFCRNNGYAISTPACEQFRSDGIAPRAAGYGMKTIRVDGEDALAVYAATQAARQLAVENNEPVLIEAVTYRLGGHSTSDDPSGYRTKTEEAKFKQQDPVLRFQQWLLAQGWIDAKEEEEREELLKVEILAAVKVAEKITKPALDELITDVYAEPTSQLVKQLDQLKQHIQHYPDQYPQQGE